MARARLVDANIGLVISIARRFSCRTLAFDDLVSEGMVGLIQAIDQFDPARGVRFGSFAARLIERSIQRAVGEASGPVRLPPKARRLITGWRRATCRFRMTHGMPAEARDVADELGVSVQAARALECTDAALSGYPALAEDTASDAVENQAAADGSGTELIERVRAAIDRLDPKTGAIVRMAYGLTGARPLSPRAIAEQTGFSVERVHHVLARTLSYLRNVTEPADSRNGDPRRDARSRRTGVEPESAVLAAAAIGDEVRHTDARHGGVATDAEHARGVGAPAESSGVARRRPPVRGTESRRRGSRAVTATL